jgi:DNA-binding transcriptional ArsR family regulator
MVMRLSRGGSMTTGALTGDLTISRQAAERHLKVLEQSGLVQTTKKGRERIRSLDASRLRMVQEWMKSLELAWSERLWRLRESYD